MTNNSYAVINDDCVSALKEIPDNSFDSIVTDPPYELGFMGKSWDSTGIAYSVEMWREVLRVLKPGGHLLAFSGTRTYHRMTCAIEDAGFEIRDQIQWLYGQGFPKSLDVSKAIDKAAGAEREVVGKQPYSAPNIKGNKFNEPGRAREAVAITAPSTDAAKTWSGWGTALKPANEPICLARKPLSEKTVAANVLKWGTGALNIDVSRIAGAKPDTTRGAGGQNGKYSEIGGQGRIVDDGKGRFPANLLLSCDCESVQHELGCAVRALDEQTAGTRASKPSKSGRSTSNKGSALTGMGGVDTNPSYADSGGASRFFYVAKVSPSERNAGLEGLPESRQKAYEGGRIASAKTPDSMGGERTAKNHHPTVKPLKLMRYLCRLVTPPGGVVLDPFTGSGSTGVAALQEGLAFVGIERESEYTEIATKRLEAAVEDLPEAS